MMFSSKSDELLFLELRNKITTFEINWIGLQINNDQIVVSGHGEGGYSEGKELLKEEAVYLFVRGCVVRNGEANRILFLIIYIPENSRALERSKSIFQAKTISEVFDANFEILLIDSQEENQEGRNLEMNFVVEMLERIIPSPSEVIINEKSNDILREYFNNRNISNKIRRRRDLNDGINFSDIFNVEETYVYSMELFINHYITQSMKLISPELYQRLLNHFSVIVSLHKPFLKKVEEGEFFVKEKPQISEIVEALINQFKLFRLYTPYVNDYQSLLSVVTEKLRNDLEFRKFCEEKSLELKRSGERCHDITTFLVMPLQRIPAYQLHMKIILESTHHSDPNFSKIEEGYKSALEIAKYMNMVQRNKKMFEKAFVISKMYKMDDLISPKRKLINFSKCRIRNEMGEIAVFTDLVVIIRRVGKKIERISLTDQNVSVYKKDDSAGCIFVIETPRKKIFIDVSRKDICTKYVNLIKNRISISSQQNQLLSLMIYSTHLWKENGARIKKKKWSWVELTADMKIKYFMKQGGRMKGSFSVVGSAVGKINQPFGFYISTPRRTYRFFASDFETFDTWLKVLEMVGLEREDLKNDEEEEEGEEETTNQNPEKWNDREYVLNAVKKNGLSLEFASEELKNDKEVVMAAVGQFGRSLKFASDEIRNVKEIVMESVTQNGFYLQFAGSEMRRDKDVVMMAVTGFGKSLGFASRILKNDIEVVVFAVKQNGMSLENSSREMKNEKSVVLEAVKQNGMALQHASERLRNDKEVVFVACSQNRDAFQFVGDLLSENSTLLGIVKMLDGDLERAVDETETKEEDIGEKSWREFILKKLEESETIGFQRTVFGKCSEPEILEEQEKMKVLPEILKKKRFSDFKILKFLGRGVYGETFLCHINISKVDRLFVMKIYRDTKMSKKKRVELVSRDSLYLPYHKNVVTILSHSEEEIINIRNLPENKRWLRKSRRRKDTFVGGMILMKFHRKSLSETINELPLDFQVFEVSRMLKGIVDGVCHLYDNMIVHRDLHPGNIFVDPKYGRIWVGDFGCALDLRMNSTGFKVHKDHEMMFSFTLDSYFMNGHLQECGFKKGGFGEGIAPEIKRFNPLEEIYLDYTKSDVFSVGVLGRMLLKKCSFEKGQNTKEDAEMKLCKFLDELLVEDPKERINCKDAKNDIKEINLLIENKI